jgi:hypothetical protein
MQWVPPSGTLLHAHSSFGTSLLAPYLTEHFRLSIVQSHKPGSVILVVYAMFCVFLILICFFQVVGEIMDLGVSRMD